MKNKLSVKQNGFRDCASACLLSIIRYYGGNISKEEINYIIKTDTYGTNAYNLIEGAKRIGFDGYGMKVTFNELLKYKEIPVIAHTKSSNMYHYVVIYEINKKNILIMDPISGLKRVSHKEFDSMYLETILYLYPIKTIPNIKIKDKIINNIFLNIIQDKKNIIKLILLSILITIFTILLNFYLKVYIDYIYVKFSIKLLLLISIYFFIIIFLKNIFENIRSKILINVKLNISSNITNDATKHIMSLPYCHFKNKPTGEIISRLDDLENFKELISTIFLNIFVNILLVLSSTLILLLINKTLFFIGIIIVIAYAAIVLVYSRIFKNKILNVQESEGQYKKELVESINGYETLKNLNILTNQIYKLKIKFNIFLKKLKNFEYSFNNEKMLKTIISDIGIIFIASIGIYMVNKKIITLGDLIAFISLILFFTEPIKELLNLVPSITYAINSYDRINDFLLIESERTNNMNKEMINGDIKVNNLSFSYNNIDNIFKNINLYIKKGNNYLIYGKSGNGKSTFIKILLKYIENYKGSISINNINLKDIDKDIIRNSISYISQNEILFSDTIKNNIVLGRNIKDNEYNEIIKICKVDNIIDKKRLRNNFLLEENGFNLSGGERQKIILARGLIKNNNILILDEVLSEIGFDEEKEILKGIFKKYEKKTIIYISHKKEVMNLFKYKYFFSKKGEILC